MTRALRLGIRSTLALAGLWAWLGGCSLETDALGSVGGRPDGGDAGSPPDGAPDRSVPPTDSGLPCESLGGPRVVTVLDGDHFASSDAELTDVEVERPGQLALAVSPYRYGGILARGHDGAHLADPPSFDDVLGLSPSGRAILGTLDGSWSEGEAIPGLLLDGATRYTVVAAGEIFLDAGSNSIRLEAGGRALVEIGEEGAVVGAVATASTPGTASFVVPTSGWYPIRLAWQEGGGGTRILLELTLPDSSTEVVGPARLRVDLSELPGRDLFGWDSRDPDATPDGERIDRGSTVEDFATVAFPQGVGIADSSDFTARWVGRHVLGTGGTLAADADDHHELWLDGVFLGQDATAEYTQGVPAGTYDLIFELDQGGGGRRAELEYDGAAFPLESMHPRTRFGGVPFGAGDNVESNVDAGNDQTVVLTVDSPEDPVAAVEISAVLTTSEPEAVQLSVLSPGGDRFDFTVDERMRTTFLSEERRFRAVIGPDEVTDASGDWELTLVNGGTTRTVWDRAGVLVHSRGESDPYADVGTFVSGVIDLRVETAIERVQGTIDQPFGTAVAISVRAARTESGLVDVDPVPVMEDTTLAGEARGRFVQVEVTLSGPGHDTPRVSDLRLVGRPCLECEAGTAGCPSGLEGLVARYTFEEGAGRRVRDVSGVGEPLDLYVFETDAVTWSGDGLTIDGPTVVSSVLPAQKIVDRCQASSELTIEAWVRPADTTQDGPARIVTLSLDAGKRDFTFGQSAGDYVLRLRSSETDDNGSPDLVASEVQTEWQHLVWARDATERLRVWVDGRHVVTEDRPGDFSNWEPYAFALGNELEDSRPWLGGFREVAIYCRALTPDEVAAHFSLGAP